MPATEGLQPALTPGEKAVVRSYGGWTSFMHSMALKPWEAADAEQGKQIAATFAARDEGGKMNSGSSKADAK